jgi:SP family general alpha glucoside:H+ symporter-like MFS transporter
MIIHTNALERSMTQGTSYLQLFQGDNLRRTIIACVVWMSQNTCGNVVGASASFFLTSAGMATTSAYSFNVGIQALGFVGTFGGWFFMVRSDPFSSRAQLHRLIWILPRQPYFGRRTIWLYGLLGMECLLLIIGGLGL